MKGVINISSNSIERVTVSNPFGKSAVCSHVTVTDVTDYLVISDCMQQAQKHTLQFWIKANGAKTITVALGGESATFDATTTWDFFDHTYNPAAVRNINITFPAGEYWIYHMQMERGTILSDWRPHPDDVPEDVSQILSSHTEQIASTALTVNQQTQQIQQRVTNTTFTTTINGINGEIDKISEGVNKWLVEEYNRSDFTFPGNNTSLSTIELLTDNPDVKPLKSYTIEDTSSGRSGVTQSGRILYYVGYAKFSAASSLTISTTSTGKFYVNGTLVSPVNSSITVSMIEGWNIIEYVGNQSRMNLGSNISEDSGCTSFNCMIAVPQARAVRVRNQFSELKVDVNSIVSAVGDVTTYSGTDTLISRMSTVEQTASKISWVVASGSSSSSITLTSSMLSAMTDQFVVKNLDGTSTVISGGKITTDLLKSSNYVAGSGSTYSNTGTFFDLSNGAIHSKNFAVTSSGAAYINGTIVATAGSIGGIGISEYGLQMGQELAKRVSLMRYNVVALPSPSKAETLVGYNGVKTGGVWISDLDYTGGNMYLEIGGALSASSPNRRQAYITIENTSSDTQPDAKISTQNTVNLLNTTTQQTTQYNRKISFTSDSEGKMGLYDDSASSYLIYAEAPNTDNSIVTNQSYTKIAKVPRQLFAYDYVPNFLRVVITSARGDGYRVATLHSGNDIISFDAQFGTTGTTYENRALACTSSDIRLKKNLEKSEVDALDILNRFNMYQFDWKSNDQHWDVGMVVDEIEKLDPNFRVGGDSEDGDVVSYKSINHFYLLGYVVKAIQELSAQNEKLKAEIAVLKK